MIDHLNIEVMKPKDPGEFEPLSPDDEEPCTVTEVIHTQRETDISLHAEEESQPLEQQDFMTLRDKMMDMDKQKSVCQENMSMM